MLSAPELSSLFLTTILTSNWIIISTLQIRKLSLRDSAAYLLKKLHAIEKKPCVPLQMKGILSKGIMGAAFSNDFRMTASSFTFF